ncbi:MAG TPA: hypothetical protein ACFYEK_01280 [Candidatus Wunengus sp. YC60]|uniref:hypothetical protein n=1 Tax=Candidatus Wunengus sp. YC60 TaxID=3367697 RepID=UPI004029663C
MKKELLRFATASIEGSKQTEELRHSEADRESEAFEQGYQFALRELIKKLEKYPDDILI